MSVSARKTMKSAIVTGALVAVVGLAFIWAQHHSGAPADSSAPLGTKSPSLAREIGPLPQPAPVLTTNAPAQPVVLIGTFASTDPTQGSAIIGRDEQSATLQRTHTEVAPGVWLREVYGNRVVIERGGGNREVLTIASSHGGGGSIPPVAKTTPATPLPASGMQDDVRFGVSSSTDEMQGVHVFPGRNRGAFAKSGLHPGDLITEINGVPTKGLASPEVSALLKNGSDSVVTVFRAGRLQQINVHGGDGSSDSVGPR
jgi:type II secretory pathway component PulC